MQKKLRVSAAVPKRMTTKGTAKKKKPVAKSASAAAAVVVQGWSTDPMGGLPPSQTNAPALPGTKLATKIVAPASAPAPRIYPTGTAEFRFWSAAEALRRSAGFWAQVGAISWNPDIGKDLPVRLDDGVDLNAYYARNDFPVQGIKQGLSFFHDQVRDLASGQLSTVFSGESPDVVAHELGHAVLDALKPGLWNLASIEAAAFHEAFGDTSSILTALQLPSVRQAILEETGGKLARSSSVSRVAEQLGYAIRQRHPDSVDRDSLRNASNTFVYTDPTLLPSNGPASGLTAASHNFARVFTGAFLEVLSGMVLTLNGSPGPDDVLEASLDMGKLLAQAVVGAPIRATFFQAVAEQLVLSDRILFHGKYAEPIRAALVRRRLLPLDALATPPAASRGARARMAGVSEYVSSEATRVTVNGAPLGLMAATVHVEAPAAAESPAFSGAATAATGVARLSSSALPDVEAFLAGLVVRGRVRAGSGAKRAAGLDQATRRKRLTHHLVPVEGGVELQRLVFECGHCA